jgi:hypothetical protein
LCAGDRDWDRTSLKQNARVPERVDTKALMVDGERRSPRKGSHSEKTRRDRAPDDTRQRRAMMKMPKDPRQGRPRRADNITPEGVLAEPTRTPDDAEGVCQCLPGWQCLEIVCAATKAGGGRMAGGGEGQRCVPVDVREEDQVVWDRG